MKGFLVILILTIFTACNNLNSVENVIEGKTYTLNTKGISSIPTIKFKDGKITGQVLNRFFTSYRIVNDKILIDSISKTKMAGPSSTMRKEREFTRDLEKASKININGKSLTLTTTDGKILHFIEK